MGVKELVSELKSDYVDSFGMVVQRDRDGGDSLYRTSLAVFLMDLLGVAANSNELWTTLQSNCIDVSGEQIRLKRHPDLTKWYSNADCTSRDQVAKFVLCAMQMHSDQLVSLWWNKMKQSVFFHDNRHKGTDCIGRDCYKTPDFIGVGELNNYFRFKGYRILTFITDFRFILDLVFRKFQAWDYDSLLLSDLIYAKLNQPSIFVKIAVHFYKKTNWKDKIRSNYALDKNGIPPLGELYILAGDQFL